VEESASANSDGLDFGALHEYGFTSLVNERANGAWTQTTNEVSK